MINYEGIGQLEGSETTSLESFSVENVEYLQSIEGLQYDKWKELSPDERLDALRMLESRLAEIQGRRPPLPIVAEEMDSAGFYDGKALHINIEHIKDPSYRLEVIDTVAHEGRHAYQHYAVTHPGFHKNEKEVLYWAANQEAYFHPKKICEKFGLQYYVCQPVELDAFRYGWKTQELFDNNPFKAFNTSLEEAFSKLERENNRPLLHDRTEDLCARIKSRIDSIISPATQMNIIRAGVQAIRRHA